MTTWPLGEGRKVTSPFGPRQGGYHYGTDFGRDGGSANMPVYAVRSGTIIYAGAAQGYGGPDPAGWLVIDHPAEFGGGCSEYGHIIREVNRGDFVHEGQRIGRINPDSATNGGTSPHLHLSIMPREYNPAAKIDPIPWLGSAQEPGQARSGPNFTENNVINNWRGRPYGNSQSRNGQKVRFLVLHTSEGAGGAGLLDYMQGASVSYHDVVDDTGANKATIWHLVDKNRAAWSVGNGNNYTVNYCFGTSFATRHSRADWLRLQDDSIKALAWQVSQDCKRFNIPPVIMVGGSASGYPALKKPGAMGITDHRGMTTIAGGNHTDVGDQFPWGVFGQYLHKYYDNEQDDMFTDEDRELLKRVHFELTHPWNSASMYAAPDEVADPKNTLVGVTLAIDGMTHALVVEDRARKGDEDSIMRLIRTAAGEGKYGNDPRVMSRAEAALEEVPEDILDAYLARQ